MTSIAEQVAQTPYDIAGGANAVREIVDRFYDLMEAESEFAELRALHADDLSPMRESLSGFLSAWLGGPRDWFEQRPGRCLMSAHNGVAVTAETARQWAGAMRRAIESSSLDGDFGRKLADALSDLALRMA